METIYFMRIVLKSGVEKLIRNLSDSDCKSLLRSFQTIDDVIVLSQPDGGFTLVFRLDDFDYAEVKIADLEMERREQEKAREDQP